MFYTTLESIFRLYAQSKVEGRRSIAGSACSRRALGVLQEAP
jgi:hypothetical protein